MKTVAQIRTKPLCWKVRGALTRQEVPGALLVDLSPPFLDQVYVRE